MAKHRKAQLMKAFGDNKVSNTQRLRKKYQDLKMENIGTGIKLDPFTKWAKDNFPNVKIVGG